MSLITALDNSLVEAALVAHLTARFTTSGVTVPKIGAESVHGTAQPKVIAGLSTELTTISEVTVSVKCPLLAPEADGWYAPTIAIALTWPRITGMTTDALQPLFQAIAATFPARPKGDATTEDKLAWQALEDDLSEQLLLTSGHEAAGWRFEAGRYLVGSDRIDQLYNLHLGIIHPSA